ncbi:TIGR04282 family arsenosugar biosynthesis glycosyltransferase [Lacinutrix sp.]|uniref:TIGR04282 family arsenosugar biosynthesis glycosyltransferase n=1 Tax=Lacinutrix sp. TaxID=1937692 RepID=UPI0025B862B1|nr:TIGR04282 family arsenosugar biosynthesis glycosyltransferase [Lacinutrix sp.]
MHKNLIITFTRNPELGKVKSRLAKGIGEASALEVYKLLLEHTKNVLLKLDCDKAVYYSVKVRENDIWNPKFFSKHQQFGDDLGERMYNAFDNGFKKGYEKIIIVGSDLYDLNAETITKAFKKLDQNDNVIGPAEDGGYYLLGMKTLHPSVFKIENWGTETVYKQTILKLNDNSVYVLNKLNDIDYVEDLVPYTVFKPYLNNY